ncbi:unnamed protein product [Soboliphyme baturini]|uniref:Trafficking protein particle complex subunit 8 n=1 Tax=Soboliphyme baturini TaxID=241478 RepID=A0A183IXW8_9BILA|nr:unnamed protein product [Soboliphyme baturini]
MKTTYGAHACHLLRINALPSVPPDDAQNAAVDFAHYWNFMYLDTVQNFDSLKLEVDLKDSADSDNVVKIDTVVHTAIGVPLPPAELTVSIKLDNPFHSECIPHPLSNTCLPQLSDHDPVHSSSEDAGDNSTPNLQSFTSLSGSAFPEKLPQVVQEMTFALESWEMQMRRLADLAFMFQLYDFAFQLYHTLRKEFSTQQAWLYYAGACEAASLCIFLLGAAAFRPYPSHYMEGAVSTYANTARRPWLAARAGFFSSSALCAQGAWGDAADQLIKMTSSDDLKSSLFLEEAARCFYNCGMIRKAALHFVLAGHRFSKAGLRHYTVYCYKAASALYQDRGWRLAEVKHDLMLIEKVVGFSYEHFSLLCLSHRTSK